MNAKHKEKLIDDVTCQVNQFTGTFSFKLLIELIQLLGPTFSQILGLAPKEGSILDIQFNPALMSTAITHLVTKLDPENNLQLVFRILSQTRIDGVELTKESFDLLFQGRMLLLFKVVRFAVEVNYHDFLPAGDSQNQKQTQPPAGMIPS